MNNIHQEKRDGEHNKVKHCRPVQPQPNRKSMMGMEASYSGWLRTRDVPLTVARGKQITNHGRALSVRQCPQPRTVFTGSRRSIFWGPMFCTARLFICIGSPDFRVGTLRTATAFIAFRLLRCRGYLWDHASALGHGIYLHRSLSFSQLTRCVHRHYLLHSVTRCIGSIFGAEAAQYQQSDFAPVTFMTRPFGRTYYAREQRGVSSLMGPYAVHRRPV